MKKPMVLTTLLAALLAVAGILIVYGISASEKTETGQTKKPKKAPVVEVAPAARTTVSQRLALSGSVAAYQEARLASPAEGPVEEVRVREGDRVKAGETLLTIGRKKGADALIASLREELEKEKDNLDRIRQLVESQALSEENLDQARAAFENVRARLVQAEESAGDYTITAPWDGVVSNLAVREGEFAAPRTVLMEMYDPDTLVIRAAVPERYAAQVRADMEVEIRLDAFPEKSVQGRIERAYPFLDERLRTRTVEIVPDRPLDMLPGMFARLQVIFEKQENAVVVPKEAVVATPGGKAVFVVEDKKAVQRQVKTGIEEERRIQIVTGVLAGDRVVIAGHQKLKPGAVVRLSKKDKPENTQSRDTAEPNAPQQGNAGGGQQ